MRFFLRALWLLGCGHACLGADELLRWETNGWLRTATLNVAKEGKPGFTRLPETVTGLAFTNHLADLSAGRNQVRMNGSGVALGDIDGDGLCDIYFCRLEGSNRLYRNLGSWRFVDITDAAGVACVGQYSTGAALADVDGDGDLDLLVNAIGVGTRLFFNDGTGRFSESRQAGLARPVGSMSFALADLDGDGDLDVYVANYRTNTIRSTSLQMVLVDGKRQLRAQDREQYEISPAGRLLELGDRDVLLLNDGHGQFTPAAWNDGRFVDEDGHALRDAPRDWGLSVMIRDFDGDGSPDIYVCNDFWSPDRLWLNDGHGKFRAAPRLMLRHTSSFSMGIDVADIDRDGRDDFLVLDMLSRDYQRRLRQRAALGQNFNDATRIDARPQIERNTLFWNRGDGTYAEIAQLSGLEASEWSWAVAFLDVDLDGYEDVLITNGNQYDMLDGDNGLRISSAPPRPLPERLLLSPRLYVPNLAFRNRGNLTFEETGARWGFNDVGVSHGLALADLDNDGDLDVVVNNLNGPAGLYRNDATVARVAVRLRGRSPNTHGIGARLRVSGGPLPQSQVILSGGRYLSCDDAVRAFAAGAVTNTLAIEVDWPSGAYSRITHIAANTLCEITEPPMANPNSNESKIQNPQSKIYEDVSSLLHHRHRYVEFGDSGRSPWLSRRLDTLGPGVSWFDFNGDGRDDLLVAAGSGNALTYFQNDGRGGFELLTNAPAEARLRRDQTTVLGWRRSAEPAVWLAGSNYEEDKVARSAVEQIELGVRRVNSVFTGWPSTIGPMALGDVDGDGELELFVGERFVPGRYPAGAGSRFLRRQAEGWQSAPEYAQPLSGGGLVNGAVFSDLDNDGYPELILACDWGPLKIFWNDRGRLAPAPLALGLGKYTGWWNGVTTADVDGDGRLDIIASNWGRNTPYEPFRADGIHACFGEISGRGVFEFVEACWDPVRRVLAPWRDRKFMANVMPWIEERFPTTESYASASLEQIFGPSLQKAASLRVDWLDSTVFLNRGIFFEARPLPIEAQLSPAFGVCAGDFDGDGAEDIFLAQNFFGVEETVSRYDAGLGLWLRGDGRGNFTAVSARESGVRIEGEQRGAALSDFDGDGRIDLVVGQHNAETRLFRNLGAKPGLRVRLRGPAGNPDGIGAVLRAQTEKGTGTGPAHEIHAGSGHWSQDSATVLFTGATRPHQLSVRWPGGRLMNVVVPTTGNEILIGVNGDVQRGSGSRQRAGD
jgi:hypothetical protein